MGSTNVKPRSGAEVNRIRKRLEEERARIQRELSEIDAFDRSASQADELGEVDYDQHPADVATNTFMRERDEAIHADLKAELGQVLDATHKLDAGTYGNCGRCGKPIGGERLKALPYATLCMPCATLAEGTA